MTGTRMTQTERLTIRPYQLTDYPSWLAQTSVPSSGQPDVTVFTEDWFETWIAEQQQRATDDLGYCFGVFRTTASDPSGSPITTPGWSSRFSSV